MALAEPGDDDPEAPDGDAGDEGLAQPGPSTTLVRDPRNEHDREDREADAGEDHRGRDAFEDDPADDRDDRRQDAGDRRDDAHPTDRQPAVQGGDPDATQAAGDQAQQQVRRAGHGLAAEQGDAEREGHADGLRQQDDAEHGRAPAGQPATEIAGSPGGRSGQPERDRGRPRGQGVDQAPTPVGTVSSPASDGSSTPSSTAVGPGSSTTASAALSYRSDVVR